MMGSVVTMTTNIAGIVSNETTTVNGVVTRVLTPGTTRGTVEFVTTILTPRGERVTRTPTGDTVDIVLGGLDHIEISPTGPLTITAGSRIALKAIGYDYYDNVLGMTNFKWERWYGFPQPGGGTLWPGESELSVSSVFTAVVAGQIGIRAYTTTGYMQSPMLNVTILPGRVATATVSASPQTVPVGGSDSDLIITLRDAQGNLVSDGTAVTTESNIGALIGDDVSVNGEITRTFTSDIYYGTVNIYINGYINGFKAGGDQLHVEAKATVTASPAALYADGESKTTLTITLFDPTTSNTPAGCNNIAGVITGSTGFINAEKTIFTRTLRASDEVEPRKIFVGGLQAMGEVPMRIGPATKVQISAPLVARLTDGTPMLMADGNSAADLYIRIYDDYGHVITNPGSVSISTKRGF